MFTDFSLSVIAIAVTVLWLISLAYYIYLSRQQRHLQQEIEELEERLEPQNKNES
jgi:CcmD family protein